MKRLESTILIVVLFLMPGVLPAQAPADKNRSAAQAPKKNETNKKQQKKIGEIAGQRTLVDALDEQVPLEIGVQLRIFRQARTRRSEIERLEGELDRRSARLKGLIDQVESRYKTLRMIQDELAVTAEESQDTSRADEPDVSDEEKKRKQLEKVAKLAKVFNKMKAEDAAKMIPSMEIDLVVAVIERIKPKQSAKILSKIDPEKAAQITGMLTGMGTGKKRN
ncbi:MAG: hypothetical protein VYA30_04540 [Myxococcota bacterium]|nr:hypothetical protein [Myxococcota bacterium]